MFGLLVVLMLIFMANLGLMRCTPPVLQLNLFVAVSRPISSNTMSPADTYGTRGGSGLNY
jgi:hypothetical protein